MPSIIPCLCAALGDQRVDRLEMQNMSRGTSIDECGVGEDFVEKFACARCDDIIALTEDDGDTALDVAGQYCALKGIV